MPLPHLGIDEEVRVCDGCHIKLKLAKAAKKNVLPPLPFSPPSQATAVPQPSYQQHNAPSSQSVPTSGTVPPSGAEEDFDEDMKKAIEMSLKEAEQQKNFGRGYTPSQQPSRSTPTTTAATTTTTTIAQVSKKKRMESWELRKIKGAGPMFLLGWVSYYYHNNNSTYNNDRPTEKKTRKIQNLQQRLLPHCVKCNYQQLHLNQVTGSKEHLNPIQMTFLE